MILVQKVYWAQRKRIYHQSIEPTCKMSASEKLCLQWNDFKDNVSSSFGGLREDKDLTDVTLACEDGQHVEAHKVILAASSPFFKEILKRNKHPHPLIYMRGLKSEDLLAIIDLKSMISCTLERQMFSKKTWTLSLHWLMNFV